MLRKRNKTWVFSVYRMHKPVIADLQPLQDLNPSPVLMKKDKFNTLVLALEIVAIVFLHSLKGNDSKEPKQQEVVNSAYYIDMQMTETQGFGTAILK